MKIRTKFLLSAMTALHLSETNIKRSFSYIMLISQEIRGTSQKIA